MNKKFYFSALLMACTLSLSAEEVITDTTLMTFNMMGAMPYYRVNYTYESVAPMASLPSHSPLHSSSHSASSSAQRRSKSPARNSTPADSCSAITTP